MFTYVWIQKTSKKLADQRNRTHTIHKVFEVLTLMKNCIKILRIKSQLTQADLAVQLGVSRQTVNAVETGKCDPSLPLAFKIAQTFGMPIEHIFDPVPESALEPV